MTVPTCRTLTIEAESRTLAIPAEGTGSAISATGSGTPIGLLLMLTYAGSVAVTGTPSERTLVIPAESRTLTIECDGG